MQSSKQKHVSALILGAAALVTNLAIYLIWENEVPFNTGNIFVYCSAAALGFSGALISAFVSNLANLYFLENISAVAQTLLLAAIIALAIARYPKLTIFSVTLAWFSFTSILSYLYNGLISSNFTMHFAAELLFSMIAGALLLNTSIWGALTNRPRHVDLASLLTHFLAICAAIATLSILSLAQTDFTTLLQSDPYWTFRAVATMLVACVLLPIFFGSRLATKILCDWQEFSPTNKSSKRSNTFTNLNQDSLANRTCTNLKSTSKTTLIGATEGSLSALMPKEKAKQTLSPDLGICAVNADGTITFVNRKFRQLSGMHDSEILGKRIEQLGINHTLIKHISDIIARTISKGPCVTECKLNQLPDKLRYFEVSTRNPESMEGSSLAGGPNSVIITLRDITDRRSVEAHLLKGQKLASLAPLLNNLAHAFNNTLTAIVGHASFARRTTDQNKIAQSIDQIIESSKNAGALVNQLLDFSTAEPGAVETLDLSRKLQANLELFKKIAGESYELTLNYPNTPLPIDCDSSLLIQVVTNLINNARESYHSQTGKIEIVLAQETIEKEVAAMVAGAAPGHYVRMQIKDYGCGMSAETLGKAFNPLFTTKQSNGNTGLGLSIVYAIVRALDGFLTMESHVNKGTTISIYLPFSKAKTKEMSREDRSKHTGVIKGNLEKVLVVEDEQNVRELVTTMLKLLGYDASCCSSGTEAVETSKSKKFDLFLVDMVLPKAGGLQVINQLKASAPHTKSMIMTGHGTAAGQDHPEIPILAKPFDIETLSKAIRNVLDQKSQVIKNDAANYSSGAMTL